MKKLMTILMAIAVVVTMSVTTATVFAAPSPQAVPTTQKATPNLTVNGSESADVIYTPSSTNANEITFSYIGDGTINNWETNLDLLGLVEGVDYTITKDEEAGTLTITFISQKAIDMWNNGMISVNAVVTFDEESTEEETKTTKKNTSPTSPSTGAPSALAAGSIALLGAGIAVVAAKKKDAE